MTALTRMHHPVRPNSSIMAPRCSDPYKQKRSSHTSLPNRTLWTGFSTCKPKCKKTQKCNCYAQSIPFQKPAFSRMGELCLKKSQSFLLTFSWCSRDSIRTMFLNKIQKIRVRRARPSQPWNYGYGAMSSDT